jgi:hypothetical protein
MISTIPAEELAIATDFVVAHRAAFPPEKVIETYRCHGLWLVQEPDSPELVAMIRAALDAQIPYSVVRIGDGEANLLTYLRYSGTPQLDRLIARAIIEGQADRFNANDLWLLCLRELMQLSIASADVVGVRGFWWGRSAPQAQRSSSQIERVVVARQINADPRVTLGVSRAADAMLKLAASSGLKGKTIASAHLYLAILEGLDVLISAAQRVLLITNRIELVVRLQQRWPEKHLELIEVGRSASTPSGKRPLKSPKFLDKVHSQLPQELGGALCLVGAGPWSEIYCTFIKQNGGVGIDLGSGFDLMDGVVSRPIHRALGLDQDNRFAIHP